MVDTFLSYYIIGNVLTALGQTGVWVICLLLLIKQRSLGSILLFIGSTLIVTGSILGIVIQSFIARTVSPELLIKYQGIIYIVNSLFYLIFALGFIILILKYLKISQFLMTASQD